MRADEPAAAARRQLECLTLGVELGSLATVSFGLIVAARHLGTHFDVIIDRGQTLTIAAGVEEARRVLEAAAGHGVPHLG